MSDRSGTGELGPGPLAPVESISRWRMAIAILVAAGIVTGCGGSTKDALKPTTTAAATTSPAEATTTPVVPADCEKATENFARALGISEGSVVREDIAIGPGIASKGHVSFIAASNGAAWVTTSDATAEYDGGIILPLNDQARATSEWGVGLPAGAPPFAGITDHSPGAVQALKCAAG